MKKQLCHLLGFIISILIICSVASSAAAYSPKQIYQKAGPGVVFILAAEGAKMGSVGTGSIIRRDGLVLTNAHIFTKPGSSRLKSDISIFLKPPRISGSHRQDLTRRFKGQMLAYDIPLDLALLRIVDVKGTLTTIDFADSSNVVIGDQVYAIGHPEQGGLWSLTTGVISAYRQDYGGVRGKNLFQTDASINRGNSGGPLLDETGDMVGINSLIARKAADGLTITDVNYSIQTNVAIGWLKKVGYRFQAKRPLPPPKPTPSQPTSDTITKKPEESRPVKTEPIPSPNEDIPKPSVEPVEEKPVQPTPKEPQKVTPSKPEETPTSPKIQQQTPEIEQPKDPNTQQKPKGGKILTKKKPYKVRNLLKEMQEMEDMMDDMRIKIDRYKKQSN